MEQEVYRITVSTLSDERWLGGALACAAFSKRRFLLSKVAAAAICNMQQFSPEVLGY